MLKDEVFKEQALKPADFKFSKKVADVFDDMVNRSVPFYAEMQRMIAELAANHALDGTNVYDLGCSTGTSFLLMDLERYSLGKRACMLHETFSIFLRTLYLKPTIDPAVVPIHQ